MSFADAIGFHKEPPAERRTQPRFELRLEGELVWAAGGLRKRTRCTIVDMSLDGASVDTGYFVETPEKLFLHEFAAGNLFECQVKWHLGRQIGLFFLDTANRSLRRTLIQRHQQR